MSFDEVQSMQIGQILDYMTEYVKQKNPKKQNTKKATQNDFDMF